ncbi:hypothetical protein BBM38_15695 [Vibrio parahaemolyticus]|nr:hypothetical protein BBM38_15695 [Vibrio parahaemolyticus]ODZ38482.1 hypothetical protein BBM37_08245 [Vibrio parahaemolyticus]OHX52100.1 hypothetical protein BBZ60_23225 [Vibrio parahaemolyticus]
MESITNFIKGLNEYQASFFTLFLVALFTPGTLIMFMFQRDLFISLDTVKLILVCVSISFPLIIVGSVPIAYEFKFEGAETLPFMETTFAGAFVSLMSCTVSIFVAYCFSLNFLYFCYTLILVYISVYVATVVSVWRNHREQT